MIVQGSKVQSRPMRDSATLNLGAVVGFSLIDDNR
jgi:hypothetical protein